MAKKKISIDAIAFQKSRYEKHLARASAKQAARSGIRGRSFAPVAPEPVAEPEITEEPKDAA